MKLYTPKTVLAHEAQAASQQGMSLWQLMQRAGQTIFNEVQRRYRSSEHWLILAGPGNNGGDAYLVGALALASDYTVTLCAVGEPKTELAKLAKELFERAGGAVSESLPNDADVIIDGLFGAGFRGSLPNEEWISQVNRMSGARIAIDVPSGVNGTTGWVETCAFYADLTIQMVAAKQGLYTSKASDYCGEKIVKRLGVELSVEPDARLVTKLALPCRSDYFNKGNAGHVKVIGAGRGMAGAAYLTALAALKAGAGKVSVFCHQQNVAIIASMLPEAMVLPIDELSATDQDVLAIGPGLGRDDWGKKACEQAVAVPGRKIVDADGLYWLPKDTMVEVITPHPGEAARLLNKNTQAVEADRFESLHALAKRAEQVVLKGNGSLVWHDGVHVIGAGSPAMAAPGMGDVLTGVIAALMAQKCPEPAVQGALWHALAGAEMPIGSLASEVANRLTLVRASLQN
ncbi:NAD(P)H-hydrate dehydratase [Salinibius halmophilus]|uniref:NAD(P)H-hydrate dehydratase n=1 Tax=Salinibius halmophilus TaxID=1853216 RepID=UPI000E66BDCF|nr:NAD(P)H-hydrate dehydratase [Salinibius halmophilus]